MDKLNVLAKLIIKYPEEHSMLLSLAAANTTNATPGKPRAGNIIPYSEEASAQGLSLTQQLGYAASRGILDTGPMAAKQVATGKVPLPSIDEVLTVAWNSSITDWTLVALAGLADGLPAGGIAVSTALSRVMMGKALAKKDYLGVFLSGIATVPVIGDLLSGAGRAIKQGFPVAKKIAVGIVGAIAKFANKTVKEIIKYVLDLFYDGAEAAKNIILDNVIAVKDKFTAELNRFIASATSGQPIRMQ